MTPDRIFVDRGPGETRVALAAGQTVLEIVHIRAAEAQPGAVYAGRVGERAPGSHDVFVDTGFPPHGLLETKGEKFSVGQWIAVEVLSPARGGKGHKLARSAVKLPEGANAPGLLTPAPDLVAAWRHIYKQSITDAAPDDDFTFADIEDQIDAALEPAVALPGGGRVIFEQTAALVAVDIDAGASSIETANAEAMIAIAHHIRLRNLAGHIVVDLIPTRGKQRYVEQLKKLCAADPVDTRIMGLTPSGMIDIVRRRRRPSLAETLLNDDTTAYRALRLAVREMTARKCVKVTLSAAPAVAALLNERLNPALMEARDTARGEIAVVSRPDFAAGRIEVS